MPDWDAIRKEYESSRITFKDLATKHGVPMTTLYDHSRKWSRSVEFRIPNEHNSNSDNHFRVVRSAELPSIPSAVDGANLGIEALVLYLREKAKKMNLMEHVKAATALSQYNRIIVNAIPIEEVDEADLITVDTRDLSEDRLLRLKAFALEMKESEQTG